MTRALKASGYLPPTREEIEAEKEQRRIGSKHALLTFHAEQPETIQTCLRAFNPAIWELAYRTSYHPQAAENSIPAIPKFVNDQ